MIVIPVETFKEWDNPSSWISYPKVAIPAWVNLFLNEKIPEHRIFDSSNIVYAKSGDVNLASHQFGINFDYDDFPNDSFTNFQHNIKIHHYYRFQL